MLAPSGAIRLRKMILPHIPGGRAPPGSGLGATPPYAAVTIFILGDYRESLLLRPRLGLFNACALSEYI